MREREIPYKTAKLASSISRNYDSVSGGVHMAKNIEINYNSGSGYEILYPKTLPELTGCLPLTGGTLTGPLMLNGEPSGEMEAVNKGYVDEQMAGILKPMYEGTLNRESGTITLAYSGQDAKIIFISVRMIFSESDYDNGDIILEGSDGFIFKNHVFVDNRYNSRTGQSAILVKNSGNTFTNSLIGQVSGENAGYGNETITISKYLYWSRLQPDYGITCYLTVFGMF